MNNVATSLSIPAFDESGIIQYAFTTRRNDLGVRTNGIKGPDDWNPVAEMFGIEPGRLVTVNQVHGEAIVQVDETNFRNLRTSEADSLITSAPGIAIGVETADCVSILLLDPKTPAVAAIHAGWRSTVKQIVRKTIANMHEQYGSDPARLIAAIGPAIGPECYEVDEAVMGPVRTTFAFWQEVATPRGNDRWSLDLARLNRLELIRAGLSEKNVYSFGLCTSCNRDLFYSFRREGRTGRMLSAIMIKS